MLKILEYSHGVCTSRKGKNKDYSGFLEVINKMPSVDQMLIVASDEQCLFLLAWRAKYLNLVLILSES